MVERDINFEDPVIQRKYEEAMERLGPAGRVQRSFSLLVQIYKMLMHSVSKENTGISERELRRLVALRLYQGDEMAVKRLEELK